MRTFEILLLVMNGLTLLLSTQKLSRRGWVGVAALNVLVLLLHLGIETARYQLAFAYLFVLLFLMYALAKGRWQGRLPNGLRISALSVAVVLLTFTAFLAYALPVFTLPALTGDYAVGTQYITLVDETRTDPFLDTSTQKRELLVKIYYPAKQDNTKPFAAYFGGSTQLLRAFAAFYQMPPFFFDHLALVQTHTKAALELADAQQSYPVVLFSHGAGTTVEVSTAQSEDLASHGYIVLSIDHPYVSAATVFPDRVVTAHQATTTFDTPEPAAPITQIMADDDKFVIDQLTKLNEGSPLPAFQGKLDLDKIGVIGHSVGGAVAYNMALNDNRVKAAINLDGVVYVIPKATQVIAPFLMLANDQYHVQAIENQENLLEKFDQTPEGQQAKQDRYGSVEAYEAAYSVAQQTMAGLAKVLKASGNLYTIEGSDHMKFTDIGLFIGSRWLRELLQIHGNVEPIRCLEITQALTVTFFDQHLKGQPIDGLTALEKTYPELKKIHLK